jgi:hypothetical protein
VYDQIYAHLLEVQLRTEHASRRAALLASLGPLPKPAPMRLFRRRTVTPLARPVEVLHYEAPSSPSMPRKAA